jgi:hypothetical protein
MAAELLGDKSTQYIHQVAGQCRKNNSIQQMAMQAEVRDYIVLGSRLLSV